VRNLIYDIGQLGAWMSGQSIPAAEKTNIKSDGATMW